MTTIVFDGTSLAADGIAIDAGTKHPMKKIIKGKHRTKGAYVAAGYGNCQVSTRLHEWYRTGAKPELYPEMPDQNEDCNFAGLVVIEDVGVSPKVYEYVSSGSERFTYEHVPKWAWGTGRNYALGAMAMGANARQAVEVAIVFDPHSGGEVSVVDVSLK